MNKVLGVSYFKGMQGAIGPVGIIGPSGNPVRTALIHHFSSDGLFLHGCITCKKWFSVQGPQGDKGSKGEMVSVISGKLNLKYCAWVTASVRLPWAMSFPALSSPFTEHYREESHNQMSWRSSLFVFEFMGLRFLFNNIVWFSFFKQGAQGPRVSYI